MGKYSKTGSYAGYTKNNKEREALDYYSTPSQEVTNILNTIGISLDGDTILEPCAGGGHMIKGIEDYFIKHNMNPKDVIATDVMARQRTPDSIHFEIAAGKEYDFLSDDYPYINGIDHIIMNPPFSTIEPFTMKALQIAKKSVLLLGRLQFLEGQNRYKNIFQDTPPSDVWVYVDRIVCYKNGDLSLKPDGIQAYAWYYFDKQKGSKNETKLHWIRRV